MKSCKPNSINYFQSLEITSKTFKFFYFGSTQIIVYESRNIHHAMPHTFLVTFLPPPVTDSPLPKCNVPHAMYTIISQRNLLHHSSKVVLYSCIDKSYLANLQTTGNYGDIDLIQITMTSIPIMKFFEKELNSNVCTNSLILQDQIHTPFLGYGWYRITGVTAFSIPF